MPNKLSHLFTYILLAIALPCYGASIKKLNANRCTRCIMANCQTICRITPGSCKTCILKHCRDICPPITTTSPQSLFDARTNIS
jgi:hypothetical protein